LKFVQNFEIVQLLKMFRFKEYSILEDVCIWKKIKVKNIRIWMDFKNVNMWK
jgi:hypothetical protein